MPKYISLLNWTDQGVKAVQDSPQRLDAAREAAREFGCDIEQFFMTFGKYDNVVLFDAPDDTAAARMCLKLSALGNVHMQTSRAFTEEEYRRVLADI